MCLDHGRQQPSQPILYYLDPDERNGEPCHTTTRPIKSTTSEIFRLLTIETPILLACQAASTETEAEQSDASSYRPCDNLSLTKTEGMDFWGIMLWHKGVGAVRDLIEELRKLDSWQFKRLPACLGEAVLAQTFVTYRHIGARACRNPDCLLRKAQFLTAAPPCSWQPFRELVATMLSCWFPGFLWLLHDIFFQQDPNENFADMLARYESSGRKHLCVDISGVIDTYQWSLRVAYGREFMTACDLPGSKFYLDIAFNSTELKLDETVWPGLQPMYEQRAIESSKLCREAGICSSRLWNLSLLGSRGMADIAPLALTALKCKGTLGGQGGRHSDCTEQLCQLSQDNSFNIKQLHKCGQHEPQSCSEEVRFSRSLLDKAFENGWRQTAWQIRSDNGMSLCKPGSKYMAISHVWSDGTGVGLKAPGHVNKCLLDYFVRISRSLGCDGIWWDTISIPEGKRERRIALSQMLRNYEMAEVTLVHDQELTDLQWDGDGSAAVALALSAWFTRGWTAAELFASRKHPVKVIFGNPDPAGPPLVKDLDDDILVRDSKYTTFTDLWQLKDDTNNLERIRRHCVLRRFSGVPPLGHFIATDIISRLRGSTSFDVSSVAEFSKDSDADYGHITMDRPSIRTLLLVLRSRVTSWAKDRFLIPALMILPTAEVNVDDTDSQVSQKLLRHFKNILMADLFHGSVPVTLTGPWSWCPPSIFDLGTSTASIARSTTQTFRVLENGTIISANPIVAVKVDKSDAIMPFGTHPAAVARTLDALRVNLESCLLVPDKTASHHLYFLAAPVWIRCHEDYSSMSCRWLGTVLATNHSDVTPKRQFVETKVIFGADCDTGGQPLPFMLWSSAYIACHAFARGSWTREGYRWFISDGSEYKDSKREPKYVPQPVCIYPNSASDLVLRRFTSMKDWETAATSYSAASFALYRDENTMDPSLLKLIPADCMASMEKCNDEHSSPCQGKVDLSWAFPCPDACTYDYGATIHRRVWRSTFHVMWEEIENREFCIGSKTFRECIEPHIRQDRDDSKEAIPGLNPEDGEEYDDFVYTATFGP